METTEKNWGAEAWRAPDLVEGETVLFSECGRILGNIDYRSHYFSMVKTENGTIALLVKHGGGQERIEEYMLRKIVPAMEVLDSNNRYLLMHAIFDSHYNGRKEGIEKTSNHYQVAFVEGRLKKRKLPKQGRVKVWIEHPLILKVA